MYQGRWRSRVVAVKKLRVATITVSWFLEFLQEIAMLQQLRHANLVGVHAAYLRPLCILLEWVDGGTLHQAIARFTGPHDWDVLATVLRDVAVGMAFLHGQPVPVFHRDLSMTRECAVVQKRDVHPSFRRVLNRPFALLLLKVLSFPHRVRPLFGCDDDSSLSLSADALPPSFQSMNILVCRLAVDACPSVKIADLGSSCRSLGKVSGRPIHNPRWKPPELFGGSDYTGASDVYCFSLIMWELVGRTVPFHELDWPSVIEDRIVKGERPSLEGLGPLRPDYVALMGQCWAQDPEERPSFQQVVDQVQEWLS